MSAEINAKVVGSSYQAKNLFRGLSGQTRSLPYYFLFVLKKVNDIATIN